MIILVAVCVAGERCRWSHDSNPPVYTLTNSSQVKTFFCFTLRSHQDIHARIWLVDAGRHAVCWLELYEDCMMMASDGSLFINPLLFRLSLSFRPSLFLSFLHAFHSSPLVMDSCAIRLLSNLESSTFTHERNEWFFTAVCSGLWLVTLLLLHVSLSERCD